MAGPPDFVERLFYLYAGIFGFVGVALGAFAAHGLKWTLQPDLFAVFETAVRYQMYHVFALCVAAWGWARWPHKAFVAAGWLFVIGIVIFSGSLYLLALTGMRWLGAITPLGGLAFLTGWLCLVVGTARAPRQPHGLS
jgi:uncharacterized membrane protein YgdD (TMEM256/DUF423 family)